MDQFEELRQMEEAVNQLGDTPPEPEDVKASEEAPIAEPVEAEENLSGGLSEKEEPEEEEPLSVDDLLGISEKEPEEEASGEPATEEETVAEPSEPDSSVETRMREMSELNRYLKEQNELLIRKGLGEPGELEDTQEPESELEPDVKDYLRPYIDAEVNERMAKLEAEMAPLRQQRETQSIASEIAKHVDGFEEKHVQILEENLKSMSDSEKPLYTGSMAGAILLAKAMADSGKLGLGKSKATRSSLARRHHSESSGRSPVNSPEMSEQQKVDKLMKADGQDILDALDRMGID